MNINSSIIKNQLLKIKIIFFCLLSISSVFSQTLSGIIKDDTGLNLEGVSVFFLNTNIGTATDQNGAFVLFRKNKEQKLVVSYTGFKTDTLNIPLEQNFIKLSLNSGQKLNEVTVNAKRQSNSFSLLNPLNVESITSQEFKKAACCSLSESFQTGNTIDVSYNNAVTGSKEIIFLGLRGIYTQLLLENFRFFNGILTSQGFDFIPGTWLDNINILKGASTSIYGPQSMTGAINVGLKKPDKDHRIYSNAFLDYHGRLELNQHFNKSWSAARHSGIYAHYSNHQGFRDHNNDGFKDDARAQKFALLQRNTLFGRKMEGQINFYGLYEDKNGGQLKNVGNYNFNQKTSHIQAFGNLGYVGYANPDRNSGSIWELSLSNIDAYYGTELNPFKAKEFRFLGQVFYSEIFSEGKHKINIGPNVNINIAEENYIADKRTYKEITPSLFFDYDYAIGKIENTDLKKLHITLSQRLDYVKSSKLYYIPRLSTRFNFDKSWTLRSSVGLGYRHPRVYSDNLNLFFVNYEKVFSNVPDIETSINYGINLVGKPLINNKELNFNLDFYITEFNNQLVTDLEQIDQNFNILKYYNVVGNSNTKSLGITVSYPIVFGISAKIGMKYTDNITGYEHGNKQTPFIAKRREMTSLDYESNNKKWTANLTGQWIGKMRIPQKVNETESTYSKEYFLLQSTVNYILPKIEFYIGCENITNYTQHHAILSADAPFSRTFNATEIYAPINGIKPFIGFRYKFK